MTETKKWYESSGIWGAVATVVVGALSALGYATEGLAENVEAVITSAAAAVTGAIALRGRLKATKKIG